MERTVLLLVSLCYPGLHLTSFISAQMISQPPVSTTAALGTNATFSCHGTGSVLWQINGTQVRDANQVLYIESVLVYVPLPRDSSSELIVTATEVTNASLMIICAVDPGIGMGDILTSDPVQLLVYAEPNPPTGLSLDVDGLALVATWTEPFSLEGEDLSYLITVMNRGNVVEDGVTVNTTRYIFSEPIGERDCSEYIFTVFSENSFSKSLNGITGRANIPTEPLQMRSSDVDIRVSFTSGTVSATIDFRPRDPCPAYPVGSYNFTITERDTDQLVTSLIHAGSTSLVVGGSNGLVANQIYMLTIEAMNTVGSSISEDEILLYTTGLQSSTAVMELNGSITVNCTFAPGASSTGCQVTIFTMDNMHIFSRNITRPNEDSPARENILVSGLSENSVLLVKAAELLAEGGVTDTLFQNVITVTVVSRPTTSSSTVVPTTTTVQSTPNQSNTNNSCRGVSPWIAVVLGVVVVLLMAALVIMFCYNIIISCRKANTELDSGYNLTQNDTYGINDNIQTLPNAVYGIGQRSEHLVQEVCSKPDGAYECVV